VNGHSGIGEGELDGSSEIGHGSSQHYQKRGVGREVRSERSAPRGETEGCEKRRYRHLGSISKLTTLVLYLKETGERGER